MENTLSTATLKLDKETSSCKHTLEWKRKVKNMTSTLGDVEIQKDESTMKRLGQMRTQK